ncbi:MAG: hypothetical protein MJ194_04045 [Clostridia bacterium]|nr:hypothetical protein [Clostridia bacterium]
MPSKEEARIIIQNIEEKLNALYPDHPEVNFSNDPQLKRTQQVMLYRFMKRSHSFGSKVKKTAELDKKYLQFAGSLLNTEELDPVMAALLKQEKETQAQLLEEMIVSDSQSTWFEEAVSGASVPDAQMQEHVNARENVLAALFAPRAEVSKINKHDGHPDLAQQIRTASEKIEANPLNIPTGSNNQPAFTEREAAIISFASFFTSESLTSEYYNAAKVYPGSTLPPENDTAGAGRMLFIEDVFTHDTRPNIDLFIKSVPDSREMTQKLFDDYQAGDRKQMAKVLKSCVDYAMKFCKGTQDHMQSIYFNSAQIAGEAAAILMRPEFKGLVEFTEEEKLWAKSVQTQTTLRNDVLDHKAELMAKIAKNASASPKDFVAENSDLIRRYASLTLHMKQHVKAHKEITTAVELMDAGKRREIFQGLRISKYDKAALTDPEAYIRSLEDTDEVSDFMKDLAEKKNLKEVQTEIKSMLSLKSGKEHTYIDVLDNLKVHTCIDHFAESLNDPGKYKELTGKLKGLSGYKKKMSSSPSLKDIESRISEYETMQKYIQENYSEDIPGHEKNSMAGQNDFAYSDIKFILDDGIGGTINHLKETAEFIKEKDLKLRASVTKQLEQNGYKNFSVEFADKKGNKVTEEAAADLLKNGETPHIRIFPDGECIGKNVGLQFDFDRAPSYMRIDSKELLCTREVDVSADVKASPQTQIEKLKHFRDILKASDPFYVRNSSNFNKLMRSLDNVIKTQEALPANSNIRQISTLKEMYETLDTQAQAYIASKSEELSSHSDDRGQLRLDTVKSLCFLTGKRHVHDTLAGVYTEQGKLKDQEALASPISKMMRKWQNTEIPAGDTERIEEFKNDFISVSEFVDKTRTMDNNEYVKLSLSRHIDEFISAAENLKPEAGINNDDLSKLKDFARECTGAAAAFIAQSGEIPPAGKSSNKTAEKPAKSQPNII